MFGQLASAMCCMYLFILRWGTNFGKLLIKYLHKTNSDVKLSSGDYFRPKESVLVLHHHIWGVGGWTLAKLMMSQM